MPPMSPPPDEHDGLAHLRRQLEQLHRQAGAPSTRAIAGRASQSISHTTVAAVLRCTRPPRWAQIELVVEALQGDLEQFRTAWLDMRNSLEPKVQRSPKAPPTQVEELRAEIARISRERDELRLRLSHQARRQPAPPAGAAFGRRGEDGRQPAALRMILGRQLQDMREANGMSREDAAWEIRAAESKIAGIERGRVALKERDVADLLALYGVTDQAERAVTLALVRQSQGSGWWHRYTDPLPSRLQPFANLERRASLIRTYDTQYIPGLLQTPQYAQAVVRSGRLWASPAEIEQRLQLRAERQRVLQESGRTRLWAIIHESVLHAELAGQEVMREQIAALLTAAERRNVRLQLISGQAPTLTAFALLRCPDHDLPDIVYVELTAGALYMDDPDEVAAYSSDLERIAAQAEHPGRTLNILRGMLQDP